MNTIVFDIETGPLPESELAALVPPFDPAEVKTGNVKDPEKVAAKIAEAEVNHRRDFFERAALDALTGRVLAIGAMCDGTGFIMADADESELIAGFWSFITGDHGRLHPLVGFNICNFDLPFLIKRSWKLGLSIPYLRKGRYWVDGITDLRDVWQLGDRQARGSLDAVARHLGCGSKTGNGADFAKLFESDRGAALDYLKNDVALTAKVARKLGVAL